MSPVITHTSRTNWTPKLSNSSPRMEAAATRNFLGLGRQCAELPLPIGRLQFDNRGEVLSACQALGQVEDGICIPLGDINEFAVERHGTLAGGVEGPFEHLD
jgi:hypothetical protein